MKISHAILHIFDLSSDLSIYSQEELDIGNNTTLEYLTKHIEKSSVDAGLMTGSFKSESKTKELITKYNLGEISFLEIAHKLAEIIYKSLSQSDMDKSLDIIICDYQDDFNNDYIAVLECVNAKAYTHYVDNNGHVVKNELVNHYAILPNLSQKVNCYIQVKRQNFEIKFYDKKRFVNGENTLIYPNLVLEADYEISPKEAVKIVKKIVNKVADSHGSNSTLAVSKAKSLIRENADLESEFTPAYIGEQVFEHSNSMKEEFKNELHKAGVPPIIAIDKGFAEKTAKSHKIKTDTGIELSVPADYFNNSDFIEFINNVDGTISIQLKNINKIQNK